MDDFECYQCIKFIDYVKEQPLSEAFLSPVPRDAYPDYYMVIKRPTSILGIRRKLEYGEFRSFEDFKEEFNLIWENAKTYNMPDSLIYIVAEDLQAKYAPKLLNIRRSEVDEWVADALKSTTKINSLMNAVPIDFSPADSSDSQAESV